jgi:hypothetical protein
MAKTVATTKRKDVTTVQVTIAVREPWLTGA